MKLFRRLKKEDEAWSPARAPVAAPRGENEGRTGDAKPLGGAGRAGGLFQVNCDAMRAFMLERHACVSCEQRLGGHASLSRRSWRGRAPTTSFTG